MVESLFPHISRNGKLEALGLEAWRLKAWWPDGGIAVPPHKPEREAGGLKAGGLEA